MVLLNPTILEQTYFQGLLGIGDLSLMHTDCRYYCWILNSKQTENENWNPLVTWDIQVSNKNGKNRKQSKKSKSNRILLVRRYLMLFKYAWMIVCQITCNSTFVCIIKCRQSMKPLKLSKYKDKWSNYMILKWILHGDI